MTNQSQGGVVLSQTPGANKSAQQNSTVTIVVGKYKPPTHDDHDNDHAAANDHLDRHDHVTALRVAVLGGGRSSEHEVSLASAASVRDGLREAGHEPVEIEIGRDGVWRAEGDELSLTPGRGLAGVDVVFPVLHGPFGEDGTVQGLLECLDVPYVGAGVLASALCMDKVLFKDLMADHGIPQVRYAAVRGDVGARRPRARLGCRCSSSRRGSGRASGSRGSANPRSSSRPCAPRSSTTRW